MSTQKILSVFVDESGDFGETGSATPYYLVTMVFHDQQHNINDNIVLFEQSLQNCAYVDKSVHTGPIIRREVPYHNLSIDDRRKILFKLRSFMLSCDISQHTFVADKRIARTKMALSKELSKSFSAFIRENYEWFLSYDSIVVYYDNGQSELCTILTAIFNALLQNVDFRTARPFEYKLLQVADFVCAMELLKLKFESKTLSKSEEKFFYRPQELKKTFIKPVIKIRK